MRNMEMGSTSCCWDRMSHSRAMNGMALLGRALPMVLLVMINMAVTRMLVFRPCSAGQIWPLKTG